MDHLEGRQSVLAALQARQRRFQVILIAHGSHTEKLQDVLDLATELNVPIKQVERAELDSLAHGQSHGGVLAIASAKPLLSETGLLNLIDSLPTPPLLLLLEGVDDARNLGFTLRSAEAMGATAVLIKKHLWDFDPVEIARPASGAYERLSLVQFEDVELLKQLKRRQIAIHGCIAGVRQTIYDANLAKPTLMAIGGEKRGLSAAVRNLCDILVTIPTTGGASSLSLSHAAAIVLAEAHRQRRKSSGGGRGGEEDGSAVG